MLCVTLNINGAQRKRQELDAFVYSRRVSTLCLQETLLPENGWILRLRGFQTYSIGDQSSSVPGARGMAVLVHQSIPSYLLQVGAYGQSMWVRLFPPWAPKGVVLGNVYVGRHYGRKVLREVVERFKKYSADGPCILMGDFNRPKDKVRDAFFREGVAVCSRVDPLGPTYIHGTAATTLDHCFYNSALVELCEMDTKRYCGTALSDHVPVGLRVRPLATPPLPPETVHACKVDGVKWWEDSNKIALSNRWGPLVSQFEDDNTPGDELYDTFVRTSYTVASESHRLKTVPLTSNSQKRQRTYTVPKAVQKRWRRVRRRRRIALLETNPNRRAEQLAHCNTLLRELRRELAWHSQVRWYDHMHELSHKLVQGRSREWWRFVRQISSNGQQVCPIVNDAGELVISGDEVMEAWREHFQRVFTDASGLSRNRNIWTCIPMEEESEIKSVSKVITWEELAQCIHTSPSGKSPGASGIPVDFLKACLKPSLETAASRAGIPPNNMAHCLLTLVNRLFLKGDIPDKTREKWLVAIPKKGDLSDRNNYRGIALMDTALKLVTRIVGSRIMEGLEKAKRLIPEQGGFRPGRECISQVIALYEVIRRMKLKKQGGYAIFIDIEKAYDRVLHEALFHKLWHIGIRGKCYEFLRKLYATSRIRVRTQAGLSKTMDQALGVHQGDPFSPVGFSVYINDVFDTIREHGYKLDGISRLFVGLLFADDMVLLARNRRKARAMLAELAAWGELWGLSFGVKEDGSKCAVMALGSKSEKPKLPTFTLMGRALPWVKSYRYLGITVSDAMHAAGLRQGALKRARAAFTRVRHILMNSAMPVMGRIMVFNNIVVNTAMYGAELWSDGTSHTTRGFNSLMQDGLSLCFGYSSSFKVPTLALGLEANMAPFGVRMMCARMRLYEKLRKSPDDSWLSELIKVPLRHRCRTWVSQSARLHTRFRKQFGEAILSNGYIDVEKLRHCLLSNYVKKASNGWQRAMTLRQWYCYVPWSPFSEWLALWHHYGGGPKVERQFFRMRVGQFWTARKYAEIGWLPERYLDDCPFCASNVREDLDHYLFVCPRWAEARVEFNYFVEKYFPDVLGMPDRALRVLGTHPVNLSVVGLAAQAAAALLQWEKVHVLRRGWIRARAPLWKFLARTLPSRWKELSPLVDRTNQKDSSSQSQDGMTGAESHHEQNCWESLSLHIPSGVP